MADDTRDRSATTRTVQKNLSFTPLAAALLDDLSEYYGNSRTGILERMIRDEARALGLLRDGMVEKHHDDPEAYRPED